MVGVGVSDAGHDLFTEKVPCRMRAHSQVVVPSQADWGVCYIV